LYQGLAGGLVACVAATMTSTPHIGILCGPSHAADAATSALAEINWIGGVSDGGQLQSPASFYPSQRAIRFTASRMSSAERA
jgi:hypothetical protein